MTDADDRRVRQALRAELVEALLSFLVERSRRFVEKQPIGALQQDARESEALLLGGRELERPVTRRFESLAKIAEPACVERVTDRVVRYSSSWMKRGKSCCWRAS